MAVEHINENDTLNTGRVKINAAIDQSKDAIEKAANAETNANQAVTIANEAKTQAQSTQAQLDNIIIENGQSDAEVVQARTKADGTTFPLLKDRLNDFDDKIGILKKIIVSVDEYGVKTDGTDTSLQIQNAIDDIASKGGGTITFPTATYSVASEITLKQGVILDLNGSTIKAIAPMAAVIGSDVNTSLIEPKISNGYIDATDQADWGIHIRNFKIGWMNNVYVMNGKKGSIKLGDSAAPITSYGMHMTNVTGDRPRGTPYQSAPPGSIGLLLEKCTDNVFINAEFIGNETGIKTLEGASGNVFIQSHNWARMPENQMNICFDIASSDNIFIGCIADTPMQYGFIIRATAWGNNFVSTKIFNGGNGGTTLIGFKIESGAKNNTFTNNYFRGYDSTVAIVKDFEFDSTNALFADGNTVVSSSWHYCNNISPTTKIQKFSTLPDAQRFRGHIVLIEGDNSKDDKYYVSKRKANGAYDWFQFGGIAAYQAPSTATDVATLKNDLNALIQKLRDAGLMW